MLYAPRWLSTISYPKHVREQIVKYSSANRAVSMRQIQNKQKEKKQMLTLVDFN